MDILSNLALGMGVAFTPLNLGLCLVGALVGTLIGVLPGLGPIATIAMLLPLTFNLDATGALIMLAGIYYGAQYGGSTTAILVNMPGESSSVVTTLDGHQMARQGRAGAALGMAALGSFFAGSVATIVVAVLGPILAGVAQQFGAPEYFSLMVLGLVGATVLASGSVLKAVAMILLGLLLGTVGSDIETGSPRLTFDIPHLADGINFTVIAIGLFGVAEIIRNLERPEERGVLGTKIRGLLPTWADIKQSAAPVLRGTVIGSALGILPGNGAVLAPYASYTLEKKLAQDPSRFGKGAIEGVAGPESANNAGAQTSFIPLLTLGIPPNPVMALMVGAMTIQGIIPGPQVMTSNPDLFWGMIASMWVGNAMLVVINLPMIGLWVRLLQVPYRLLYPAILMFCCIGVFSVNNSYVDVLGVAVFGLVGYAFAKLGFETAPLLLAFVLGPLMEENLRRSLVISRGDPLVFLNRPISLSLLLVALALLVIVLLPSISRKREEAFQE
ncbi:tripartite tricarboxylate transporter permease [Azospirillum sp. SYSU D00513]|uniref:tripartite tricarboxylate transporter permease n=1 Tax=Azospirillum sp. SYSU D00513 TaxID=2812561 RepID=UPI001A97868C|nr:tripartite tricarboxylate transporter permease [Azospirillum sp. SYSU D00513]